MSHRVQIALLYLFVLSTPLCGNAAVTYSDSAHGSTTVGVERTGMTAYVQGNCAHCHEQHGSVAGVEPEPLGGPDEFLLLGPSNNNASGFYVASDNTCFQCHSAASLQSGGIINYDYSGTFAGFTGASGTGGPSPSTIMEAFNESHSHHLNWIYEYVEGNGAYSRPSDFPAFTAGSDPCTACHNPHLAKRNKANTNDRTLSVMTMPDDHENLYGLNNGESADDWNSELMTAPSYIAPTGEPTGANTPDYNSFCLYCHQNPVPTDLRTRHLDGLSVNYFEPIDWVTGGGDGNQTGTYLDPGDKHGVNISTDNAAVDAPYTTANNVPVDVALSCVNCHEAHGSENDYTHRRFINGTPLGVVITGVTNDLGHHCLPCHIEDSSGDSWKDTHHGGAFSNDNPYKASLTRPGFTNKCLYCHGATSANSPDFPIPCEDCHFHGSYVDENDKYVNPNVKYVKPDNAPFRRKTF